HEDGDEVLFLPELAHDGEAVFSRQHDVEHDEIEMLRGIQKVRERALPVVEHFRGEALRLEVEAQPLRQVMLVFDNQDPLRHVDQADAEAAGSCSVNVLPCPCPALSANALPPCFLATEFTMK